jgi:hypothetical protein
MAIKLSHNDIGRELAFNSLFPSKSTSPVLDRDFIVHALILESIMRLETSDVFNNIRALLDKLSVV